MEERQQSKRSNRVGLSLLEVLLSIAILGGSLAVIGELVRMGAIHGLNTRLISEANILCDAKMAELSAGVLELQSYGPTEIEENKEFYFSANVEDSSQLGLLFVTVNVGQAGSNDDPVMVSSQPLYARS